MNKQVNELLTEMRKSLDEQGIDVAEPTQGSQDAEAGDLEATNPDTVDDDIEAYLTDIVQSLIDNYDISEEDALGFVWDVADAMAEEEMLPATPAEDDPSDVKAEWLGTAKTIGFAAEVLAAAEDASE